MIRMVGGLVGCAERADALAAGLERGLDAIRAAAARCPSRPRVFFEEWDDPLISGIRWVEELVEIAGGAPIFPELRRRRSSASSASSSRTRSSRRNPEVIVASWCGKAVRREKIAARTGWDEVTAVRERTHLRDQVGAHPAAGAGGAH